MSAKKKHIEHRAPDQDAAIEAAFVDGTLPEEDRRTQAEKDAALGAEIGFGYKIADAIEEEPVPVVPSEADILASAGVGSVFEKVAHGWKVTYVDGGTKIFLDGPSLGEAFVSHGMQVKHR